MSDPSADSASPSPSPGEPLQFDRAENATAPDAAAVTLECSSCHSDIRSYYYHVDGNVVCARCKQTAAEASRAQRGIGAFVKALVVGGIAAVIGAAIYYGVIALTNFEIGLVAILIGFMVGFGVRLGAGGAGGRRYQVLALVLTYFAVGLAYAPLFLKGARESSPAVADSVTATDSADAAEEEADVASTERPDSLNVALAGAAGDSAGKGAVQLGAGSAALAVAVLLAGSFFMIFALPVLAVMYSLPSGLISAAIIGFGMQQAWKMTAGNLTSITGPYRVGGESPPAAEPDAAPAT